jgi:hypothetical protein
MNCYIKFYKKNPKIAAITTILGLSSAATALFGITQANTANKIFDENDCKMVRDNNKTNSNPGRRLWIPAGIPDEDQPTYSCPTKPKVCNEACNSLTNADIIAILGTVLLFFMLIIPCLAEPVKKMVIKVSEMSLMGTKPEKTPLADQRMIGYGSGSAKDPEAVQSPGNR